MMRRGLLAFGVLAGSGACGPSIEEQAQPLRGSLLVPSRVEFAEVAPALQLRCATLDCHGHSARNLRLFGYGGLRLPTPTEPIADTAIDETTEAELDASFNAVVALEPTETSLVAAGTMPPESLVLVRKARATEGHKGGALMRPSDALDRCLTRWLTRTFDLESCRSVVEAPRPGNE